MGKLAPFMPDPVIASRNETTIRDYVDAFNRGDFERIRAICTPNVFLSGVLGKGDFDTVLPIWQVLYDASISNSRSKTSLLVMTASPAKATW